MLEISTLLNKIHIVKHKKYLNDLFTSNIFGTLANTGKLFSVNIMILPLGRLKVLPT